MNRVLVLGAGATRAEGGRKGDDRQLPPLDRGFFRLMYDLDRCDADLHVVRLYMENSLGVEILSSPWDSMESVFSAVVTDCLQLKIKRHDSKPVRALRSLLAVYQRALKMTTDGIEIDKDAYIYRWLSLQESADTVTVITFNHDLLCERVAHQYDRDHVAGGGRTMLSVPESYGPPVSSYQKVGPGKTPRFPTGDQNPSLRILKLHGSLNWRATVSA
jgi:hypothetical protein